jgi:hypothetical protein
MEQDDRPDDRDSLVKTSQPVRLLGREPLRSGTVVQVDDVDASGVLVAIVGQRGATENQPVGEPVHVRPVRLGQGLHLGQGPRPVPAVNVEWHAQKLPRVPGTSRASVT